MDQLVLLLPLILLALIIFSGRRRQRAAAETQRSLAPGVQVVTTAGLHARVVAVEDGEVVLEIAPGVHSRWSRAAVARVVPDLEPDPAASATSSDASAVDPADADLADTVGPPVPREGPGTPDDPRR